MMAATRRHEVETSRGPFALPWFTRAGYGPTVDRMADRVHFPDDYEVWLTKARQVERELTRSGILTCRLIIDEEAFLPWCAKSGLEPGPRARADYVNEMAGIPSRPLVGRS